MKKIISLITACCLTFSLAGCGKTENEHETVKVRISGSFSGYVNEVIPSYIGNDDTLCTAVISFYQRVPYALYLGDLSQQVEVGQTYVFEVEPKEVEMYRANYEDERFKNPDVAIQLYVLDIASFRLPENEDEELGVISDYLTFELVK